MGLAVGHGSSKTEAGEHVQEMGPSEARGTTQESLITPHLFTVSIRLTEAMECG